MADVVVKTDDEEEWGREARCYDDLSKSMPPCGTAGCIAGWANLLTGAACFREYESYNRAVSKLGLEEGSDLANGGFDTSTLFYAPNWPVPFSSQYAKAKTPKTRAKIACARIDHLIKTGE